MCSKINKGIMNHSLANIDLNETIGSVLVIEVMISQNKYTSTQITIGFLHILLSKNGILI